MIGGNLDSEFELNELGKEGWELVCVNAVGNGMSWYFKRSKVEEKMTFDELTMAEEALRRNLRL